MLIQCTKKLLDKVGVQPEGSVEEDPLFSWHANILTRDRRKVLVLVNDSNNYPIVLYGLRAKEFKGFGSTVKAAIRDVFTREHVEEDVIDEYLNRGPVVISKTKNRSKVAILNSVCRDCVYALGDPVEDSVTQIEASRSLSRRWVADPGGGLISPHRVLYDDLRLFSGREPMNTSAVELKATLELDDYSVWRRVIVHRDIQFRDLHQVLQTAFNWLDYHLHEFYVFGDEKRPEEENRRYIGSPEYHRCGYIPVLNLICEHDDMEYRDSRLRTEYERGHKLSDYLPASITYHYDYGDSWRVSIECERAIEGWSGRHAICTGGEGNAPPEDVGGEGGYYQFREAISDPDHPDHEMMLAWGKSQRYAEFDIEAVNRLFSIRKIW